MSKDNMPRIPSDQELRQLSEEAAIARMQAYRWDMLKRFHAFTNIRMSTRHLFMRGQIELLRGGEKRLVEIWLRRLCEKQYQFYNVTKVEYDLWRKNLQQR